MKQYYEEKRIRPDILTAAVYWALIILMIYQLVCLRIYGERGAGFAAGPVEIFCALYAVFVLAVQKSVWVMVRVRARRSQFLNAETNMKRSLSIFITSGVCTAVVLLIVSLTLSETLFGSERGTIQCVIVAVCTLLLCAQGVLRGYLQGLGYTRPIMLSDLTIAAAAFCSGTAVSALLYNYGLKVNRLFHIDEFSAVYGSSGMLAGMLVGSLVGFIQIIISFSLRKNEISEIVRQGAPRYLDNKNDVISSIKSIAVLYVSPSLMTLVDHVLFVIHSKNTSPDVDAVVTYGLYSGRVPVLMTILILLCCVPFIRPWNRVMARIERDELESARDRLAALVHDKSAMVIPVAVFVFVMAGTIEIAVFGKTGEVSTNLIRFGSPLIIFGSTAVFISWLFSHMGKGFLALINLAISWLCHAAALIIFVFVLNMGVYGLLGAVTVSVIIYDIISGAEIGKMLRYRQELVRTFLLPLFCSAVAGFVSFLLNMIFIDIIGDILTLIICIAAFYFVYVFVMVFLRGMNTAILKRIPFGRLYMNMLSGRRADNYED